METTVYWTKSGKLTTRKTKESMQAIVLGNEQVVRDGKGKPEFWGVQHMKSGKLHKVCLNREAAREANHPGRTRVVALALGVVKSDNRI